MDFSKKPHDKTKTQKSNVEEKHGFNPFFSQFESEIKWKLILAKFLFLNAKITIITKTEGTFFNAIYLYGILKKVFNFYELLDKK